MQQNMPSQIYHDGLRCYDTATSKLMVEAARGLTIAIDVAIYLETISHASTAMHRFVQIAKRTLEEESAATAGAASTYCTAATHADMASVCMSLNRWRDDT